jgi:hypothetical protein
MPKNGDNVRSSEKRGSERRTIKTALMTRSVLGARGNGSGIIAALLIRRRHN